VFCEQAYAYWKGGRHNEHSVFDLFFRKSPFNGEFTIFGGLSEAIKFIAHYKFTADDCRILSQLYPHWEPEFLQYLGELDTSQVKVYAIKEGTVVFPRIPLLRIEGPLGICQLLETTLLVLCNYASLVCTNAARHRLAVGPSKTLFEFGLRRAQGPDGAMSASKYAYVGGFDGTSNVKAGTLHGIAIKGTHAHAFVSSFISMEDLKNQTTLADSNGVQREFAALALKYRDECGIPTNMGELAAFVSYAQAYPKSFLALVDTYDTINSGVPNFLCVALALDDLGHKTLGIRLDSGDLAYLSKQARKMFLDVRFFFIAIFIFCWLIFTFVVEKNCRLQPSTVVTFRICKSLLATISARTFCIRSKSRVTTLMALVWVPIWSRVKRSQRSVASTNWWRSMDSRVSKCRKTRAR
jgi:nicotinate phosphoribosyltransferase